MLNYIVTANSITILIKNRPEIIDNTHPNFDKVEMALKAGADEDTILKMMNVSKAVIEFGEGKVTVDNGEIMYDGEAVHSALATRIISLMERGFDIKPFTNFMENLYQNPSKSAVDGLYGFLEACDLPITEDGCFMAYKKITADYLDCYTKTIDNSIGAKPNMPRYKVNEDSEQTCSTGLHVASYSYMKSYSGDRIVICKVHPKDVVAVPNDYNNAKMRVCEYEVVNEVELYDEELTPNIISDDEAYAPEYVNMNGEIADPTEVTSIPADEETPYSSWEAPTMEVTTEETMEVPTDDDFDTAFSAGSTSESFYDPETEQEDLEFNSVEEIADFVNTRNLYQLREIFTRNDPDTFLRSVTNSTFMWKTDFIAILVDYYRGYESETVATTPTPQTLGTVPAEDKVKFGDVITEFLDTYDIYKWNKMTAYLMSKGINIAGVTQVCFDLKDTGALVNKLKSLAKEGQFKKKDMIAQLGL